MDQYGKGTLHFPLELEHGKPTTQPMLTESAALPLTAHHIAISHIFSDRIQHCLLRTRIRPRPGHRYVLCSSTRDLPCPTREPLFLINWMAPRHSAPSVLVPSRLVASPKLESKQKKNSKTQTRPLSCGGPSSLVHCDPILTSIAGAPCAPFFSRAALAAASMQA